MKIKELKAYLSSLSPEMDEAEIYSTMAIGCCGETEDLGEVDVSELTPGNNFLGALVFRYHPNLAGYRSCRQVGATLKADKDYWQQFPASPYYKKVDDET